MATLLSKSNRIFKDVDFSFGNHPDTGNLLIKTDANAIRQSVINLLTLQKNNKPFHPEIRSPIYGYLFDNFTILEKVVLEGEIKNYLGYYEPRLKINSVTVSQSNTNSIECTIVGSIINLQEPFSVSILVDRLR